MTPRPSSYRWVILAVSVFGFFQTHLHRMAFAPLIPTFVSDLGLSYAAAGTIQTAYFWTYAAVQLPIGMIADRWGTRRVTLPCMALVAVGAIAFARSETFGGSLAARALLGLGAAGMWVPSIRLFSEWFPPGERALATGTISAGGGIGGTTALLAVPVLAAAWGWRWAYALTAIPAALAFVLIAVFVRPGPRAPMGVRGGGNLAAVLRAPEAWPFNLTVFFNYGAYFSFLTFLPAFLVKVAGASEQQAGLVTGLITGGTIVSWPLAGWLSDRTGRRKPLYIASQIVITASCLFFAVAGRGVPLAAHAAVALATGVLVGGMILPFVGIIEIFPPAQAATAAGMLNAACFGGGMILPIVLGRLIDVTGGFAAAFYLAAAFQVLATVTGLFIRETGARGGER